MFKKRYLLYKKILIIAVLTGCVTIEMHDSPKILAQETADKCDRLYEKTANTFKECFGVELIDTFAPKLVDSFGVTNLETEWAKLDNFFTQLRNDSKAVGYIVIYGAHKNKFGELSERPKTLKAYIKEKKIDSSRIVFVQGGFREKFEYELWTSPSNKIFPSLSPTIEPERVIFKGRMKPLPTKF